MKIAVQMGAPFTFNWTIDNYSKIVLKVGEFITSPEFVIDEEKQKWCLELYPNGSIKNPDYAVGGLHKTAGIEDVTLKFTYDLINLEGHSFASETSTSLLFGEKTQEKWGYRLTLIDTLKTEMQKWVADTLVVKCTINIEKSKKEALFNSQAKTKIGFNNATFVWCVREPDSVEWFQQKNFNCSETTCLNVKLTLVEDDVLIEIKSSTILSILSQSVTSKISVIDVNNIEKLSAMDIKTFDEKNKNISWKFPTLITKKELNDKNCLKNGFFTIILEFSAPNGIVAKELNNTVEYEINPKITSTQNFDAVKDLQSDFKQMLLDSKYSDVNLKADGELFRAHKSILSSRSNVFRAMFDSKMLESQTNAVDIDDLESNTLRSLLTFLYTGTIDDSSWENALKLIIAADKYQVKSLTEKCTEILLRFLSLENMYDIIVVADLVHEEDLKAAAMNLIEENAKDILLSADWMEWSKQNIHLAFEIASKLALRSVKK